MAKYIKYKARHKNEQMTKWMPNKYYFFGSMTTVEEIKKRFPESEYDLVILTEEN